MESWALAIAILSAIFSGLAWWAAHRSAVASYEMVKIEKARDAAEAKAAASAKIVPVAAPGGWQERWMRVVELRNDGQSEAIGLDAEVESVEGSFIEILHHGNFPCDVPPGSSANLVLKRESVRSAMQVPILLEWTDGTGRRSERHIISLV